MMDNLSETDKVCTTIKGKGLCVDKKPTQLQELKEIQKKMKEQGIRTEIVKSPYNDKEYQLYDLRSNIPMLLHIKKLQDKEVLG